MKLPAVSRSAVLSLLPGLLALCLACSPAVSSPKPKPTPKTEPSSLLEEGKPVERVLRGGERQEHRLAVQAGWYVRLEIEQTGIDVVASLLGPDGAVLYSTDDPDGLQDKEVLSLVAPAQEELRLVVTPHDPNAAPGAYRVVLVARRPVGPGDRERAAAYKARAEAWRLISLPKEQGRQEAIRLLEEALRLWEGVGEIRSQIDVLHDLGAQELAASDIPAALTDLRQALSLSLEVKDPKLQALSHTNLAAAFLALGDYPQTLDHYQQALTLWKESGDLGKQGLVLYGIGLIYRDRGDFDQALRYLSEALPLRRDSGDAQGALYTLVALAGVYQGRGEMEKASASLDQALDLSRSVGGNSEAVVLSTMAQFHRFRGELGDALERLVQARAYYHRVKDDAYEARVLHNLGLVYVDLGDLDKAQHAYEEGLALVTGKSAEGEARFLNSLGWTLYLQGDSERALGDLERGLALSREKNLPGAMAEALGRTGAVYVALGRDQEGLRFLQEELTLRRKSGDRANEAASLLELGRAWQALGDLGQAEDSFHAALDLGQRTENTGLQAACLYQWAVLDRQRGDLPQALDRVRNAIQIIESVRSRVSSEKLRTTYLASKRAWYELYIDLQMRLEEKDPGQGHAAAALEASERARARGLLDLIAEGRIDVQEGIAPDLKRQETELGARLSWIQERLGEILAQDSENSRIADLRSQLDQAGEKMEQLEEEIRRRHPRYAEVRYPTPLRLEQVQGLLDSRTALLEYFVGQEGSFLFAVTHQDLSVYRLPSAKVLEEKVQDLRTVLGRPGILALGPFRSEAANLYQILLGSATAQLSRTPNLLISPDGPLSLVPFEALLSNPSSGASYKKLRYLLRDHAVSYVPSASVLDGLREPRPLPASEAAAAKGLIAFGDPIYPSAQAALALRGSGSTSTAPQLPGSGREVEAIAHLYPASEVMLYMRENATEENVKANPLIQTARRIHFATHGFVDEVRPQLSGLMLTRGPGSGQDGLLQVYEIFNLRLNADLVALSACETGLGERITGEGMVGLTRAFLYAGARSLLVSLWPVSDLSTPDLMTAFYRNLGDSGTKAEALQRAKLERIDAGDEPYRWASFILSGDPH
ncbi:MAG TPA: CHAT domain-containing protein [Thermoanaerobaculia bacterium]|nr:CHAT domain-containing protein [Thermoanaerobaculia bacterium]